jgi:hypothetical protein
LAGLSAGAAAAPTASTSAAAVTLTASGQLTETGPAPDGCPIDYTCSGFDVSCAAPWEEVAPISGRVAVGESLKPGLRGEILFFTGADGAEYWGSGREERRSVVTGLRRSGYRTIEVSWTGDWGIGTAGFVGVTCRPTVVAEWAAAEYAATGAPPPSAPGVCGFCVVGTSVGTSQAVYPVAFHGAASLVDAVVSMGGPPTADVAAGCRRDDTPLKYLNADRSPFRTRVDDAWDGGEPTAGACESKPHDATFEPTWLADSLVSAPQLSFPDTRFHFLWGSRDPTGAVGQGITFLHAIADAGSALLDYDCISASHDLGGNRRALQELKEALVWRPADGFDNVPPLPTAGIDPRCVITS